MLEVQYEQPLPNLQCLHDPLPIGPPLASCFALRNIMPKSGNEQTFGRVGAVVDVSLPYTFVGGIIMPVPHYCLNWTADDRMRQGTGDALLLLIP